jgi:hypothetical protein
MPWRDMWPNLRKLYDVFGPRRMIYGNWFEVSPGMLSACQRCHHLSILTCAGDIYAQYLIMSELIPFFSEEDKDWILGKTALSVYKWK